MSTPIEAGAASLLIELKNGDVLLKHGTSGDLLMHVDQVPAGTWRRLFDAITNELTKTLEEEQ